MKHGLAELVCILDRSGSMGSMRQEAIGGINAFIEEQKKVPGEAKLTIVLFDNEYLLASNREPIQNVKLFDETTYQPRGTTALLDAVGRTILDIGRILDNTPDAEKPETVVVAILTDGEENASKDFKKEKIKEMIEHQQTKYGWKFIFLAADPKAFADATQHYGIKVADARLFDSSAKGVRDSYSTLSARVTSYRGGGSSGGGKAA